IDLLTDMKEEYPMTDYRMTQNLWVRWPAGAVLNEHNEGRAAGSDRYARSLPAAQGLTGQQTGDSSK
ncbi:MAG: hypothetical protein ACU0CA_08895, partial [Paracoccaceae bacterium]